VRGQRGAAVKDKQHVRAQRRARPRVRHDYNMIAVFQCFKLFQVGCCGLILLRSEQRGWCEIRVRPHNHGVVIISREKSVFPVLNCWRVQQFFPSQMQPATHQRRPAPWLSCQGAQTDRPAG
jgi:hypothetical protein